VKLAVCTNKAEAIAVDVIKKLGIAEYFVAVVGGDSIAVKKPDAEHLFYTMKQMGCTAGKVASRVAMVGDSKNDILAANNAGVPAILVTYGYSDDEVNKLEIDWRIDNFSKLCELNFNQ